MANRPNGAMGSGSWMGDMRPTPPRYQNLPASEAWKKIDEEERLAKEAAFKAAVDAEVKKRMEELANSSEMPVMAEGGELVKFDSTEFENVVNAIIQKTGIVLKNATDERILVELNGVMVEIKKA